MRAEAQLCGTAGAAGAGSAGHGTSLLAPTVTALPRRYMARTCCNVAIWLWAAALLAPVSGGWVNLTVSTSEAVL